MKKFLSLSKSADSRDRFKFTLYSNIEFSKIEYHIFNKSKLNRLLVHCMSLIRESWAISLYAGSRPFISIPCDGKHVDLNSVEVHYSGS